MGRKPLFFRGFLLIAPICTVFKYPAALCPRLRKGTISTMRWFYQPLLLLLASSDLAKEVGSEEGVLMADQTHLLAMQAAIPAAPLPACDVTQAI